VPHLLKRGKEWRQQGDNRVTKQALFSSTISTV